MLRREAPHRLPGSCLAGCPRPVPPGPTSLLLWGSELLGSSGGQDLPGKPCLPHPPTQALLGSPVGWGPSLHPPPSPWPVLVRQVSLLTLGDTPTPTRSARSAGTSKALSQSSGCLPFLERWRGPGKPQGVWGQESPRGERSGPHRKGGAGVTRSGGRRGVRESRRD